MRSTWASLGAATGVVALASGCSSAELGSTFDVCGDDVDLADGFVAFDYPETAGNEVPDGQRVVFVRAAHDGDAPPKNFADLFDTAPDRILRTVKPDGYRSWLDEVDRPDLSFYDRGNAFFPEGNTPGPQCSVSVSLNAITPENERPDEWSAAFIITTRPSE